MSVPNDNGIDAPVRQGPDSGVPPRTDPRTECARCGNSHPSPHPIDAPLRLVEQYGTGRSEALPVALAIADIGNCWMQQETIAERLGIHQGTVSRALHTLAPELEYDGRAVRIRRDQGEPEALISSAAVYCSDRLSAPAMRWLGVAGWLWRTRQWNRIRPVLGADLLGMHGDTSKRAYRAVRDAGYVRQESNGAGQRPWYRISWGYPQGGAALHTTEASNQGNSSTGGCSTAYRGVQHCIQGGAALHTEKELRAGAVSRDPLSPSPSSADRARVCEASEGDEGDIHIEQTAEARSWRSADADQPEHTTPQDEPTEECIEAAQGIIDELDPAVWHLGPVQTSRLVGRVARLLCFGGYDEEQLTAHLAAPPPPGVRDPFGLLLARLRDDRLPTATPVSDPIPAGPFVPNARDGDQCQGHPGEAAAHCRVCFADLVAVHGVRGNGWHTYGHTPYAALRALDEPANDIQIPAQSAHKDARGHTGVDPRGKHLGAAA